MASIFGICDDHENVRNPANEFLSELRKELQTLSNKKYDLTPYLRTQKAFLDPTQRSRVLEEAEDCDFFVVFLTRKLAMNLDTYKEIWNIFHLKAIKENAHIFPIRLNKCDEEFLFEEMNDSASEHGGLLKQASDHYEINVINENDQPSWNAIVKKISKKIRNFIQEHGYRPSSGNIWYPRRPLDYYLSANQRNFGTLIQEIEHNRRDKNGLNTVCVIYTGGTVGMVRRRDESGGLTFEQAGISDLIYNMPKLKEMDFDIHFLYYKDTIDSSNVKSDHWESFASVIAGLYDQYQGFVIIHGANTMAYSASALSFMLEGLKKPVIFTGSELPLTEHGDAQQNVINALNIAAWNSNKYKRCIGEVCVLFGRSLVRGNRATKKYSLDVSEGFYSPNFREFATMTTGRPNIDYSRSINEGNPSPNDRITINAIRKNKGKKEKHEVVIHIQDICPDMDMNLFKLICNYPNLHALIIRTYGTGGAPESDTDFIICLRELVDRGVIVVSLTQCPIGSVELRLFETNAELFNTGVISGGDMVTEAAYCKLKYLFEKHRNGNSFDIDKIKAEMTISEKGELTISTHTLTIDRSKFSHAVESGRNRYETKGSNGSLPQLSFNTKKPFENFRIDSAVVRFENLECSSDSVLIEMELDGEVDSKTGLAAFDARNNNAKIRELMSHNYVVDADDEGESYETNGNLDEVKSQDGTIWNVDVTKKSRDAINSKYPFDVRIWTTQPIEFDSVSIIVTVLEG